MSQEKETLKKRQETLKNII